MLLTPAPVSTRQVTYIPAENKFVGEISCTHGLGRVYDDAADEGLTLVSHKTGQEVVFVVSSVERDAEGDIQLWNLVPAPEQGMPADLTFTLFND